MENLTAIHTPNWFSLENILGNFTVLAIFASLVAAGIMRGLKEVRDFRKPDAATPVSTTAQIAAATILENVTLSEWSRTNREVQQALDRVCDMLVKTRDEMVELRHEIGEARHAVRSGRR